MPELGRHGEEPKTVYVTDDKRRARWRYEHSFSETGKALKCLVKGWDGAFWAIPNDNVLLKVKHLAANAGWRIAEASELEAPQLIPLEAIQCGRDAWFLAASVAKWRELADQGCGGKLRHALRVLAARTNYCLGSRSFGF